MAVALLTAGLIHQRVQASATPRNLHFSMRWDYRGTGRSPSLRLSRLWTRTVQPNADSAPVIAPHVRGRGGVTRSIIYVLAGNNTDNCSPDNPVRRATTYAFDARTGARLWSRSTSGPSRCTTAGPVVDPSGAWVYSPGLDGRLHRYAEATGNESRSGGWPVGITRMPDVEKMSATPTIAGKYLYQTTSGFIGDAGHYQGHLVSINLKTRRSHVFNVLCSNIHRLLHGNYCSAERAGLFGRGEGTIDPVTHDVYIVSGNGPWNGKTLFGDSVLKLDPTGAHLLDSFTPTNQASLQSTDQDLGSSGPAILPPVKEGGRTYHLLVQAGKGPACDSCSGAALRLLNRDNLSGKGGPGHLGGDLYDAQAPGGGGVLTAPAVWKSPSGAIWSFFANNEGVAGYRLVSPSRGVFRLKRAWMDRHGGTTPIMSHGVLYVAHDGGLQAYNPSTGQVLWSGGGISGVHWQYPLVTNDRLYMTDESGHLNAFALLPVHR